MSNQLFIFISLKKLKMKKTIQYGLMMVVLLVIACNNAPKKMPEASKMEEAKPSDAATLLQGKWQSVEDAKSVFVISGKDFTQYYDGKAMETREFQYSKDCSGNACAGGTSANGCFTSAGKMDIECYTIVSISDSSMEITLVGSTGNTLKYTKVK